MNYCTWQSANMIWNILYVKIVNRHTLKKTLFKKKKTIFSCPESFGQSFVVPPPCETVAASFSTSFEN